MTSTVKRLAIALTSTTAIVAAFTLAATPPAVEVATASPAKGTSLVIDLTDQHDEGSTTGVTTEAAGATDDRTTAARFRTSRDC